VDVWEVGGEGGGLFYMTCYHVIYLSCVYVLLWLVRLRLCLYLGRTLFQAWRLHKCDMRTLRGTLLVCLRHKLYIDRTQPATACPMFRSYFSTLYVISCALATTALIESHSLIEMTDG
jgi:hypothetical protein